jgi:hypothetical protein
VTLYLLWLGHQSGIYGHNKLTAIYADASTEDASRARELGLPVLPPDNDGTTWIRSGSHLLKIIRTSRESLPGAKLATPAPDSEGAGPLLLHIFSLTHDELCDALTDDNFWAVG